MRSAASGVDVDACRPASSTSPVVAIAVPAIGKGL